MLHVKALLCKLLWKKLIFTKSCFSFGKKLLYFTLFKEMVQKAFQKNQKNTWKKTLKTWKNHGKIMEFCWSATVGTLLWHVGRGLRWSHDKRPCHIIGVLHAVDLKDKSLSGETDALSHVDRPQGSRQRSWDCAPRCEYRIGLWIVVVRPAEGRGRTVEKWETRCFWSFLVLWTDWQTWYWNNLCGDILTVILSRWSCHQFEIQSWSSKINVDDRVMISRCWNSWAEIVIMAPLVDNDWNVCCCGRYWMWTRRKTRCGRLSRVAWRRTKCTAKTDSTPASRPLVGTSVCWNVAVSLAVHPSADWTYQGTAEFGVSVSAFGRLTYLHWTKSPRYRVRLLCLSCNALLLPSRHGWDLGERPTNTSCTTALHLLCWFMRLVGALECWWHWKRRFLSKCAGETGGDVGFHITGNMMHAAPSGQSSPWWLQLFMEGSESRTGVPVVQCVWSEKFHIAESWESHGNDALFWCLSPRNVFCQK